MKNSLDLTIVIPVKNEERNLPVCLAAVGKDLAQHVVVIDSNSTDRTKTIAQEWGADIIEFNWDGKFPKKRNWFLSNHTPSTKWVMFLDADEYVTEAFKRELRQKLATEESVGYELSYTTYFLGKQLKGGYPLRKLALFRVGAGAYERIDEVQWSRLDMEVHEHLIVKGPVGVIKSKIDHQDFRGVSNFVAKHHEYACWEANRFLKAMGESKKERKWNWKQRLKYRLLHSVCFPPLFFFGTFFLYGGFMDGYRGFVYAALRMSYYFQTYCKIQEAILSTGDLKVTGAHNTEENVGPGVEVSVARA